MDKLIKVEDWKWTEEEIYIKYDSEWHRQLSDLFTLLDKNGAKFTWAHYREKGPRHTEWPEDPYTVDEAKVFLAEGKTVGILMNKSTGLAVIDIDNDATKLISKFPWLEDAPQIYRKDNPNKVKIIFEDKTGALPGKKKIGKSIDFFVGGGDKGFQCLIAGEHEDGEVYTPRNVNGVLPTLDKEMLDSLSIEITEAPYSDSAIRYGRLPTKRLPVYDLVGLKEGFRNEALFKYGCALQAKGRSDTMISLQILGLAELATPPLAISEAQSIVDSVLERYSKGKEAPILSGEYVLVLAILGYQFSMSRLDDRLLVNNMPITDPTEAKIKRDLRDGGYTNVNIAKDVYLANGHDNIFHPIEDYIDGIIWDGHDHIADLVSHFKDENDVFGLWLKRWLIGAIERAYKPGVQNRVLVLDGGQDIGKSYFARWLASNVLAFHYEGGINPDKKDNTIRLMNTWIWEISELGSTTRRSDREALKHFISQEKVRERLPYGQYDTDKPALSSFIATVNNDGGFLNDPSGSRRFMISTLKKIDWAYAKSIDVDQVWGQAKALFDSGETGRLSPEEREIASTLNAEYEMVEPVTIYLESIIVVETGTFTKTADILEALKKKGASGSDPILNRGIGNFMSSLKSKGVKPWRRKFDGKKIRGYENITIS